MRKTSCPFSDVVPRPTVRSDVTLDAREETTLGPEVCVADDTGAELTAEDPGAAELTGAEEEAPTVEGAWEGAWEETCGKEVSEAGFCEVGGAEKLEGEGRATVDEGEGGATVEGVIKVCWPEIGKGLRYYHWTEMLGRSVPVKNVGWMTQDLKTEIERSVVRRLIVRKLMRWAVCSPNCFQNHYHYHYHYHYRCWLRHHQNRCLR